MRFGYHSDIFELCPDLVAGVIWVEGFAGGDADPQIDEHISRAVAAVHERFPTTAEISQWPSIAAWREIYSRFGIKPNRYQCAAENLIRQIVRSDRFPRLHPVIDLCNAAAATYAIPVAPFDASKIDGDCFVRPATGNERFQPINGDEQQEIPSGEVVYSDNTQDVLSRRWNWRQADKGKVTPETRDFLITTEAAHDGGRATVQGVIDLLADRLDAHAPSVESVILDANHRVADSQVRERS